MKTSQHGFQQAYNALTVVESELQLIVETCVTNEAVDQKQLLPMASAVKETYSQQPDKVLADAGYCSEANLAYLNEQDLDWICVQRTKTPPVPKDALDQVFKTASDFGVPAWELPDEGGERRVYLHSEARQAVSDQIVGAKRAKFEEAIAHLNAGLALPRRLKNFDKVQIRVGRLIEKYKQVAYQYDVKVTRKASSTHAEEIRLKQRPAYEACTEALGGCARPTGASTGSESLPM